MTGTVTGTGTADEAGLHLDLELPGRLVATLRARPGERIAVVGPNGSGKTSLLRAIAGTAPGRVRWAGRDWTGLPPQQRSTGLVHQDHQLFPHLSALDNVAFGPRAAGLSRRRARALAQEWLDRLGIGQYAGRRPDRLSGGQAQRVALARTLVNRPDVLLFDEPFAALDVSVAVELRELLAEHLRDHPGVALCATHEALDVHALADRVVVLEEGRVVQDADRGTVAEAPATAHAARLLGLNVLPGAAGPDGAVALLGGGTVHTSAVARGPVLATFAPSMITLTADRPTSSARNAWPARVLGLAAGTGERAGVTRVHLQVETLGTHDLRADVTTSSATALGLAPGSRVWASVKATEVTLFPARPGSSLAERGTVPIPGVDR